MRRLLPVLPGIAASLLATNVSAQIRLSEIRTDQIGADVDEYVEFSGVPGTSLAGHTLLVIGDAPSSINECGVVEVVASLNTFSIQADGYFCLRISTGTPTLTGYDATISGSIENADNLTFFLVTGNNAALNTDLDTNDDGVLNLTPWTSLVDHVAIQEVNNPTCNGGLDPTEDAVYSTTRVGPDGNFAPGHVFFCNGSWLIGSFNTQGGSDTPGAANRCAVPVETGTWGAIKARLR